MSSWSHGDFFGNQAETDECANYRSYDELPLTLRVDDLMPILGIGRNTAYELVRSKQIYSVKIGRQLRIPKQALIDYLTSSSS